jgi:hypothetical protein
MMGTYVIPDATHANCEEGVVVNCRRHVAAAYLMAMFAMMCAQRPKDTAVATMAKIQLVLGAIASPRCATNEAVILTLVY